MKLTMLVITGIGLSTLGAWAQTAPAPAKTTPYTPLGDLPPSSTPALVEQSDQAPPGPGKNGNRSRSPRPGRGYGGGLGWTVGGGGRPAPEQESPVSLIAFGQTDQKVLDETAEDLNILSLILSRKLEQAFASSPREYKLGIPMLLKSRGRKVEASYFKGFGAMLNLRVPFPVAASAAQENPGQTEQPESEWEAARSALAAGEGASPVWESARDDETGNYDGKLVETLKRQVVDALRNASNLRHLGADDWIIVNITGAAIPSSRRSQGIGAGQQGMGGAPPPKPGPAPATPFPQETEDLTPGGVGFMPDALTTNRATIMNVRIRKASAEALAAHKISEEDFAKTAQVSTYMGPVSVTSPVTTTTWFNLAP